ncbi:hypothetical protein ACFL1B_05850 [Nanoarchaeota archaeon]
MLLIVLGPASAIKIMLHSPSIENPTVGETVTFYAEIDLETDEVIPIKTVSLIVNGIVCVFPVDGGYSLTSDLMCLGFKLEPLSLVEKVEMLEILEMPMTGYGYGAYGYYPDMTRTISFGYGYGYGYVPGYGYGKKHYSELSYKVIWDTSGYEGGDYDFRFSANAENDGTEFQFKTKDSLVISLAPGDGNGGNGDGNGNGNGNGDGDGDGNGNGDGDGNGGTGDNGNGNGLNGGYSTVDVNNIGGGGSGSGGGNKALFSSGGSHKEADELEPTAIEGTPLSSIDGNGGSHKVPDNGDSDGTGGILDKEDDGALITGAFLGLLPGFVSSVAFWILLLLILALILLYLFYRKQEEE